MREIICFWLFNTAIKIMPADFRCQTYIINCVKIGFIGYKGKALPEKCPECDV